MRWLARLFLVWALVAVIVPAAALARPAQAPSSARTEFWVSLRGDQATTWHSEEQQPAGACPTTEVGDGDQMIRFRSPREQLVEAAVEGGVVRFGNGVLVKADAERGGEFRWLIPQLDPLTRQCVGTKELPPEPIPGCGAQTGLVRVHLGFSAAEVGGLPPDEELAPLEKSTGIHLRGLEPLYGHGGPLRASLPTCPLLDSDTELTASNGELLEAVGQLRESRLAHLPPGGRIKVSASQIVPFRIDEATYGQTAVAYNLVLTRRK
jgi:hypothetical protein